MDDLVGEQQPVVGVRHHDNALAALLQADEDPLKALIRAVVAEVERLHFRAETEAVGCFGRHLACDRGIDRWLALAP